MHHAADRPRGTHAPLDRDPLLRAVLRSLLTVDWQDIMPDVERARAITRWRSREERLRSRKFWCQWPYAPPTWAEARRLELI